MVIEVSRWRRPRWRNELVVPALSAFLLGAVDVHADMIRDCNQRDRTPNVSVEGCTRIIESGMYDDEPDKLYGVYVNRGLGHWGFGQLFKGERRFDEAAIADFDKAIELRPDRPRAFINRALARRSLWDHDQDTAQLDHAITDLDRAVALAPDMWQVYANRAQLLYDRALAGGGGDDHHRALRDLDELIARNPRLTGYGSFAKGKSHFHLGDMEAARAAFDHAIDVGSKDALAHWWRATVHCRLGAIDASIADRLRGLELGHSSPGRYQAFLANQGYYTGDVDGRFGPGSRQALRAYTENGCVE